MIVKQLEEEKGLTESEKQIARFLLDEKNQIELLTSIELGKLTYTSQSAVVRLYKKLGMKSYREFIYLLIEEKKEKYKIKELTMQNLEEFSSYEKIGEIVFHLYEKTIKKVVLSLDKNILMRICNRMMSASYIDVYGIGITDTLAKQFSFKLQSLGLACQFHNEYNQMYIRQIKDIKSHVSLFISLSKEHDTIIKIARILNSNQTYIASILGSRDFCELNDLCKDSLCFDTGEYENIDILCQMIAVEYICDVIYCLILSRKKSPIGD